MKVLATYNIKGGVGKTATAVNLAWAAAGSGYRTLVWDLDPQGAATFYFRIKPKVKGGFKALARGKRTLDDVVKGTDFDSLDLIPADFSYRNMDLRLNDASKPARQLVRLLRPLRNEYDVLILDCPPSISLVSENVFRAVDALLIPMIPSTLSVRTYEQLIRHLGKSDLDDVERLPFFSMVDLRKRMHKDIVAQLPARFPEVLPTAIPYASQVELMGQHRAPIGSFAPVSKPAQSYSDLWLDVGKRVFG